MLLLISGFPIILHDKNNLDNLNGYQALLYHLGSRDYVR